MNEKKGYPIPDGYMGYKPDEGRYRVFASEADYNEWFDDFYADDNEEE